MGQVVSVIDRLVARRPVDRFPDDEDGDVLWMLERHGADLACAHDIEFHMLLPTKHQAYRFMDMMAIMLSDFDTDLTASPDDELPFQVTCIGCLVPEYDTIIRYRAAIDQLARAHGGHENGWGVVLISE